MKNLVKFDDPILREKIEPGLPDDWDDHKAKFEADMIETMKTLKLFSLAASEIGYRVRALGIGDFVDPIVLYNPVIISAATEFTKEEERIAIFNKVINVKRPIWVRVRYYDPDGAVFVNRFDGLTARLLHRAINQLDGENTYLSAPQHERLRASGIHIA